MDLKGAEIRNILEMCMRIGTKNRVALNINVPYYQRPYRWDEFHISNLINDYYKNKKENVSKEYFVGSVVLVEDSEISNKYDIIDGQQRVTTVFLLNYLRFIIQRSLVEEFISLKRPNLDRHLADLEDFYCEMLGTKHTSKLSNMRANIIEKMEPLYELSDDEKEQVYEEIVDEYRKTVFLPERDFSDLDKYFSQYEQLQQAFLKNDKLALTYDRSTFNEALVEALSKVCAIVSKDNNVELHTIGISEKTDGNIKQFTDALIHEFKALTGVLNLTGKPLENTKDIIKFITEMIENIKFCVIMTGNERDAYTLFEVLNDRAMEIDDLELIKNLFLKAYCTTSNDVDAVIDNNIGVLDQVWGDQIFTRDMTVTHTKLVSYLGTIYLTADEKAFINKVERYREIIDSAYLSKFDKNSNPYTFIKAKNDIRVYQMAKLIIKEYELPVNSAAASCIKAENDANVSITFKAFHLLNALGQRGVLAALSNMVIRTFMDEMANTGVTEVDPDVFKQYLATLKTDNQHKQYKEVHQLAFKLWKSAMLCKDWELPRELGKKGIQNISKERNDYNNVTIDATTNAKMFKQFKEWAQNWTYGKGNDLKVKVLFINLFKTKKDPTANELIFDTAVYTFVTDKLQLDHMEAANPNPSNMAKHFVPADPHEVREKYTDAIGNFMILDSDNNNNKDCKPLMEAKVYYEKMCSGHWMNKEIENLLNKYHKSVKIGTVNFNVPNEKFFNERSSRLIFYFEKILNRDLDTKKIKL